MKIITQVGIPTQPIINFVTSMNSFNLCGLDYSSVKKEEEKGEGEEVEEEKEGESLLELNSLKYSWI